MSGVAASMALILAVDDVIFFWVLSITFFFTLSVVAVFSRGKRWYELGALFLLVYVASLVIAQLIFPHITDVTFVHMESVTVP